MYLVIRRFNHISSLAEAAGLAESRLGHLLKQSSFHDYYVFDTGLLTHQGYSVSHRHAVEEA